MGTHLLVQFEYKYPHNRRSDSLRMIPCILYVMSQKIVKQFTKTGLAIL
jgi:hypothetical protein